MYLDVHPKDSIHLRRAATLRVELSPKSVDDPGSHLSLGGLKVDDPARRLAVRIDATTIDGALHSAWQVPKFRNFIKWMQTEKWNPNKQTPQQIVHGANRVQEWMDST
jgi:hypothetical protein